MFGKHALLDAIALHKYDTIEQICKEEDLSEYTDFAHSFYGYVLKFGDAECIRILFNYGVNFGLLGEDHYYPWLTELLENTTFIPYSYSTGSWYRCCELDKCVVEKMPKSVRLESLKTILEYVEKTTGQPAKVDDFLFFAIVMQDSDFIKILDEHHIMFDNNEETLGRLFNKKTTAWRRLKEIFLDVFDDDKNMYIEKYIKIAEQLQSRSPISGVKIPLTNGFVETHENDLFMTPEILDKTVDCFDFANIPRKKLITDHFDIRYFPMYEKLGWLKNKSTRESIMKLAAEQNKTEIAAYMLNFIGREIDVDAERKRAEQRAEREFNATPDSVLMLNKIWGHKSTADGEELTGCKQPMEHIVIPSKIGTKTITSIGPYALSARKVKMDPENVKSVTFPETVTIIKEYALRQLHNLEHVTLPKSLKTIGYGVFEYCSRLTSIELPEGLEKLQLDSFAHTGIKTLTIPRSVQNIMHSYIVARDITLRVYRDSYAHKQCDSYQYKYEIID